MDQDRSGSITAEELQKALLNNNWSHFNAETCRLMIGMFDKNRYCLFQVVEHFLLMLLEHFSVHNLVLATINLLIYNLDLELLIFMNLQLCGNMFKTGNNVLTGNY